MPLFKLTSKQPRVEDDTIFAAIMRSDGGRVRELTALGRSVDIRNAVGQTPLLLALGCGEKEISLTLLRAGRIQIWQEQLAGVH